MLQNNLQIGSNYKIWNFLNKNFLLAIRNNFHIIDLEQTLFNYRKINYFLKWMVSNRGIVAIFSDDLAITNYSRFLFSKSKYKYIIYFAKKWIGGFLTNFKHLRKRQLIDQNVVRLKRLPDVIFALKIAKGSWMIREANSLHLPLVSVIDSEDNPSGVTYVLPGNNKSVYATIVYLNIVKHLLYMQILESRLLIYIKRFFKTSGKKI